MNRITKSFLITGAAFAMLALLFSCEYNNGRTVEQERERISPKHKSGQKHVIRQEQLEEQKRTEMEYRGVLQRAHEKER